MKINMIDPRLWSSESIGSHCLWGLYIYAISVFVGTCRWNSNVFRTFIRRLYSCRERAPFSICLWASFVRISNRGVPVQFVKESVTIKAKPNSNYTLNYIRCRDTSFLSLSLPKLVTNQILVHTSSNNVYTHVFKYDTNRDYLRKFCIWKNST